MDVVWTHTSQDVLVHSTVKLLSPPNTIDVDAKNDWDQAVRGFEHPHSFSEWRDSRPHVQYLVQY